MKAPNGQLPKLRADVRLYLFHGSDEAGAADLARRLAAGLPDAERVDIDAATLKRNPGLLADEAASISLFGEARVIRASLGEDGLEAVRLLLDAPRVGNPAIVLAPGVKASGKLLTLVNAHPAAVSVACFPASAADLERAAQALLADQGLRAAGGLARRLVEAANGDRAVVAREVEKLALYLDAAPERPRDADAGALDAIGADDGEAAQAEAVDALIEGEASKLGMALAHMDGGSASPIPWLRAMQRRLLALGDMRAAVDGGEAVEAVMKRYRIFFRDEGRTARDIRRWTPRHIVAALARLRTAETAAMAPHTIGVVGATQTVMGVARGMADKR